MGVSPEHALGSVRLSLSKYTTDAEVDFLLEKLPEMIAKLRGASPRSTKPVVQSAQS
jgi:cysteine desulfurase